MAAEPAQHEANHPTSAATLLVVSGGRDATARMLVQELRGAGFRVLHAKDGASALTHIERHRPPVMLMVQDCFGSAEGKFVGFATSLDQSLAIIIVGDKVDGAAGSTEPAGTLAMIARSTPLDHIVSIVRALTDLRS